MNKKEFVFPINAPLNVLDRDNQTYGCRQNNPEICGNNNLQRFVLFVVQIICV